METLELLTTRRSTKNLTLPAPDELQLDTILQAATQVPDHGDLKPWRFVVIHSKEGMAKFQETVMQTAVASQMGQQAIVKAERVGNMAPMILAVIASPKTGKPEWEQTLSAGCAAYAAQLAAKAQGFDSVWITGMWVHTPALKAAFHCTEQEKIIGLIMLGTSSGHIDAPKNSDMGESVQYW